MLEEEGLAPPHPSPAPTSALRGVSPGRACAETGIQSPLQALRCGAQPGSPQVRGPPFPPPALLPTPLPCSAWRLSWGPRLGSPARLPCSAPLLPVLQVGSVQGTSGETQRGKQESG